MYMAACVMRIGDLSSDVCSSDLEVLLMVVLFFLSFLNLRDANEVMRIFDHQQGEAYDAPRVVFLRQLLLTCVRDAAALFRAICDANASFLGDELVRARRRERVCRYV